MPRNAFEKGELIFDGDEMLDDAERRDHKIKGFSKTECTRVSLMQRHATSHLVGLERQILRTAFEHSTRSVHPIDRRARSRDR